jgi:hypothetical protein
MQASRLEVFSFDPFPLLQNGFVASRIGKDKHIASGQVADPHSELQSKRDWFKWHGLR